MRKFILLSLLIGSIITAKSQQIYIDYGKTFSKFDYQNSGGVAFEDMKGINQNNFGVGYRMSILKTGFHVLGGASYQRYGAKGSDPILGNSYEWDATYFGANAGFDYEFFKPEFNYSERYRFTLYLRAMMAGEFLLQGTQMINNNISELEGVEEFDKPLYFLRGAIGCKYYLSKVLSIYGQYMGGKNILIGNYSNKEQLKIITHSFNIGISVVLNP